MEEDSSTVGFRMTLSLVILSGAKDLSPIRNLQSEKERIE